MIDQSSPEQVSTPERGWIDAVDGMRLYREDLPAQGAPRAALLFAHGFGEHSGRYAAMSEALSAQGFSCFRFDFRGHGRSAGIRGHVFSFDGYLRDFAAAKRHAQARAGDLPLFVVSHSNGGLIALHAVAAHPEGLAGLAMSSPFFGFSLKVPKVKEALARQLSRFLPAFGLPTGLDPATVSHDPATVESYRTDPLNVRVATGRWFTETVAAHARVADQARVLRLPVLLQQAGDDRIASAAAARAAFEEVGSADKTWREYPGFFHEIYFELERARPLADLSAWLDAHTKAAG
ncbi:MAG: lysophospholipase [Myxococcales bacterium]|nr:lysophospholipase [Myxococcales bacterium]